MERLIRSISFSEFSTYTTCPHKWYLLYGLKYPGEVSEELLFGSCVHHTIENILTNKHVQSLYRLNKENTIRDIFKGFFKDEVLKIKDERFLQYLSDKKLSNIFMWQAQKVILELDFFNRFRDYTIEFVEFKLDGLSIYETPDRKITFKGFVDLVLKHKSTGRYLILDWKTSKKPWDITKKMKDNENFFAQLCLYKKFLSQEKGIPFDIIDTKFYNLCREDHEQQSPYSGVLNKEYVDVFFEKFLGTALKIFDHSIALKNFEKAKHVTKKNFCYRCPFNNEETCNDVDQFQMVKPYPLPIPPPPSETDIVDSD